MERVPGPSPFLAAALVAGALGCATSPARAPEAASGKESAGSRRAVAVLPFSGDPSLRRPAEELVAIRLGSHAGLSIHPPFQAGRAIAASVAAGELPATWPDEVYAWIDRLLRRAESPSADDAARRRIRTIGALLGASALLAGEVRGTGSWPGPLVPHPMDGAEARLLLVDVASGEPRSLVSRRGRYDAARLGVHQAAMDAATWAADALVAATLAEPGGPRDFRVPDEVEPDPASQIEDP